MQRYTVAPGDSLSTIATAFGLRTWRDIYDAPENASFRRLRPDPAKIRVGDQFIVPVRNTQQSVISASAQPTTITKINKKTTALGTNSGSGATTPKQTTVKTGAIKKSGEQEKSKALTAAEITHKTVFEGTARLVEILMVICKLDDKSSREAIEFLKKRAEGVEALIEFWKAGIAYDAGKYGEMTACLLSAIGKGWNAMPHKLQSKMLTFVAKILRRIPKIGGIADALPDIHEAGVVPPVLNLVGALCKGEINAAAEATKSLIKGLIENKAASARVAEKLMVVFFTVLPSHVKAELATKAIGRKFPVIGTLVMGIADGYAIYEAYQAKSEAEEKLKKQGKKMSSKESSLHDLRVYLKEAGLGSTLAGLIPGAGTVVSLIIDLGILIGTVVEACQSISLSPTGDPTT